MLIFSTGLTYPAPEAGGATRPVDPVTVKPTKALTLTVTKPAESVAAR